MTVFLNILGIYLLIGILLLILGEWKARRDKVPGLKWDEMIALVLAYPVIAWMIYKDFREGKLTWK